MITETTPFSYIVSSCKSKSQEEYAKNFLKIASENLHDINLLDHIAQLQSSIKDYKETINTLQKMLTITGDVNAINAIRSNLATTYNKINDPNSALEQLNLLPTEVSLLMERALSHYFLAEYSKSEEIMQKLAVIPGLPDKIKTRIDYNLAIYKMENGDFREGYKQYVEKGHEIDIWPNQQIPLVPLWQGEIEAGKTIIIHAEGGIGDELINVRFMKHISDLGMIPVWKTNNKDLYTVFNRNGYRCVLSYADVDISNAAQVMSMYLPIYLKLDKNSLWAGPYLKPCEKHIEKWEVILPKGKKIGLKWQGNTSYDQDLHRSIPDYHMKNLDFGGTKINLQLEKDLRNDWSYSPDINSIEDTLAILSLCDTTISSCTSVAHMTGAIGKKITVCPPIAYYYVWAKGVKWYGDHVTVIKQNEHKNWDSVFRKINDKQF